MANNHDADQIVSNFEEDVVRESFGILAAKSRSIKMLPLGIGENRVQGPIQLCPKPIAKSVGNLYVTVMKFFRVLDCRRMK
ncbi:hypothetical protein BH11VER1_BH11VER1_33480 [soil metagenome]